VGSFLGYRVTVCDARADVRDADGFRTPMKWLSNGRTGTWPTPTWMGALCSPCSTHDPKFDVPLLELALRLPVAYVGAHGLPSHQ
jgi:xanthine dehydrogenase accessory factor